MYLKKLELLNYKNFSEKSLAFNAKINCFVGKNGVGKTNILDAIYHLAFGKSYFNAIAIQNIKHNEDFFVIEGEFEKQNRNEQIVCSLKKGQKKILKKNAKIYEKFSDHVGFIPLVIISPSDNDLIQDGSETRRKFIDNVISQLDSNYLQNLIKYQKIISQRNALLKYFAANRVFETDTLYIYDEQLDILGHKIHSNRKEFITQFCPIFSRYYELISGENEKVSVIYESTLEHGNLDQLLKESINKDRILQYTSVGIHKDDLIFELNEFSIKKFGSQGQQKTFLIALKLAQFDFLKQNSGEKPILLFDDVFDKLDETRVQKIVNLINENVFGQVFLTDTHAERTNEVLKSINQKIDVFLFE
jgi:DNA replication and repair protein RecF